jgi:hypothetical protein
VKRKLVSVFAAMVLAVGGAAACAPHADAACSLHIVYTLYPYADDYPYTTTSYTTSMPDPDHPYGSAGSAVHEARGTRVGPSGPSQPRRKWGIR